MAATIKQVRRLEGEPVRMRFDDGREETARLLCATRDMDGTEHLVYELLHERSEEQVAVPASLPPSRCVYANAKTLLSIESLEPVIAAVA